VGAVIDTCVLIDLERNSTPDALRNHAGIPDGALRVSLVSIAELQTGVEFADTRERRKSRADYLQHVLRNYLVEPIAEDVALRTGTLLAQLMGAKKNIGKHDSWIAALALQLDLPVVTSNLKDFTQVAGLKVIPWDKSDL
jgi:predicted nucleic acid-binding protein